MNALVNPRRPWPRYRVAVAIAASIMLGGLGLLVTPALAQSGGSTFEQRAITAFEDGDVEGAIALYRRGIQDFETAADKIRLAVIVALLEHDLARDNAAINTLSESLALDPTYRLATDRYDEDFQRLFRTARDRSIIHRQNVAIEHVQRATEDLRAGRDELARNALERALDLAPGLPSAVYNLAYLDLRAGHENEALAGFERLIAQAPGADGKGVPMNMRARAFTNLGYLYARREQHAEAAGALEEAVAIAPEMSTAWLNLGQARHALGEKVSAKNAFERAYSLAPDNASIVRHVAESRLEAGEPASAITMLERALANQPAAADLWYTLARAQQARGLDAGPSFAAALQADLDDRQGFGALAALQLARRACAAQDATSCASYAERALKMRSSWVDALLVAAQGRRALGDLAGAQDALERAVGLDPTRAEVHNNLGDIYCRSRDAGRAEQSFLRALEIRSDFPAARNNLAAARGGGCRG